MGILDSIIADERKEAEFRQRLESNIHALLHQQARMAEAIVSANMRLHELTGKIHLMSDALNKGISTLVADVAGIGDVVASATAAFAGLEANLKAAIAAAASAGATPAQLADLNTMHTDLAAKTAALAAAVASVEPAPAPTPTPTPTPTPAVPVTSAPVATTAPGERTAGGFSTSP